MLLLHWEVILQIFAPHALLAVFRKYSLLIQLSLLHALNFREPVLLRMAKDLIEHQGCLLRALIP